MDIYHIWCDKDGDISDQDWVGHIRDFLSTLKDEGRIEGFRITRCKMGFRSIQDLPEWHFMIETTDMGQLENAFRRVAKKDGPLEDKHVAFNQFVSGSIQHALYRDWPDDH